MNIEIANRLVELRKKKGLSQEELADKLGLSRQAVSKWERAESSPDTDNLICLAKLYNVSLDDLLQTSQDVEEIKEEVREKENEKEENSIKELKQRLEEKRMMHLSEEDQKRYKRFESADRIATSALFIVAVIVYFLVSAFNNEQWSKLWVIFLLPVVISSVISCIKKRRLAPFAFPVLAAFIFLAIGMYFELWHPTWIVFLSVPLFYLIAGPIDKAVADKRGERIDPDDFDEEDDK